MRARVFFFLSIFQFYFWENVLFSSKRYDEHCAVYLYMNYEVGLVCVIVYIYKNMKKDK